ncbi:MAG: NAD(P)-dependent oxidoreductase [Betaproteobacteria bacterium]|nr:NAD(P)-dependent oxidoreductase [Betaproteobacteria bacterium]
MTILVTGGTGLIGSHVVRRLIEDQRDVVALDRLPPPARLNYLAEIQGRFRFEIGNVADLAQMLDAIKRHRVKGIIHCAGMITDVASRCPIEALNVNIIGSANMLEAARIMGLGRVVLFSSSSVMGAPADTVTPRSEEEIVLPPTGIYPLSKLACEHLAHTYRELYGVDAIALRPRNVYGPGETRYEHPMPIYRIIFDALAGRDTVRSSGGDSVFDATYVKDAAEGTIRAYDCTTPSYHVYNISKGENTTMFEVCAVIRRVFPERRIEVGPGLWEGVLTRGNQTDLVYRNSQRPPQDIARARRDFAYSPKWDVDTAIPDWVAWLRARLATS